MMTQRQVRLWLVRVLAACGAAGLLTSCHYRRFNAGGYLAVRIEREDVRRFLRRNGFQTPSDPDDIGVDLTPEGDAIAAVWGLRQRTGTLYQVVVIKGGRVECRASELVPLVPNPLDPT